ncbi:trimeric LpxA-like protein [Pavlovales sp. CCMP2436]|nr:trimeric LpxA-like protein [Pavlovales sp. CCMP2436]
MASIFGHSMRMALFASVPLRTLSARALSARMLSSRSVSRVDSGLRRGGQVQMDTPRAVSTHQAFDFESAAMPQPSITPLVVRKATPSDLRAYGEQIWDSIRAEAQTLASRNGLLAGYLAESVLAHETISSSLAHVLADRISGSGLDRALVAPLLLELLAEEEVARKTLADLVQVVAIDPCAPDMLTVLLHFKGFHGLQTHRVAHSLWRRGDAASRHTALLLQGRGSGVFGLDIHPQAHIGTGVFFDHATGVVVGQTASIGDFCYVLHGVTLGSTGKTVAGRRHPRIGSHVSLGAGSAILGPVTIGDHVLVGAHAIVTKAVAQGATVIGTNKVIESHEEGAEEFDWLNHWHI